MKHSESDLKQMQSLPLDAKIYMTQRRVKEWHDAWTNFTIVNRETGKERHRLVAVINGDEQPEIFINEEITAETPGAVYLSFSGGKDSTVLKHIIDGMYGTDPERGAVPSVFCNKGLGLAHVLEYMGVRY